MYLYSEWTLARIGALMALVLAKSDMHVVTLYEQCNVCSCRRIEVFGTEVGADERSTTLRSSWW